MGQKCSGLCWVICSGYHKAKVNIPFFSGSSREESGFLAHPGCGLHSMAYHCCGLSLLVPCWKSFSTSRGLLHSLACCPFLPSSKPGSSSSQASNLSELPFCFISLAAALFCHVSQTHSFAFIFPVFNDSSDYLGSSG